MQALYWVVADQVAAGPYPGSPEPGTAREKLRCLVGRGIRAFVDLTEPGEIARSGPLAPYDEAIAAEAPEGLRHALCRRLPPKRGPVPDGVVVGDRAVITTASSDCVLTLAGSRGGC